MSGALPPGQVDGDAHVEIVRGFRHPEDAWRSMAFLDPKEHLRWAIHNTVFSERATRNACFLAFAEEYASYSRSQAAYGSKEAAQVAAMRVAGPPNALEALLGTRPSANGDGAEPPKKKGLFG